MGEERTSPRGALAEMGSRRKADGHLMPCWRGPPQAVAPHLRPGQDIDGQGGAAQKTPEVDLRGGGWLEVSAGIGTQRAA